MKLFVTMITLALTASMAMAVKRTLPTEGNSTAQCETWIGELMQDTEWLQNYSTCLTTVSDLLSADSVSTADQTGLCDGTCPALFQKLVADGKAKSSTVAYEKCSQAGGFGGLSNLMCVMDMDTGGTRCPFSSWANVSNTIVGVCQAATTSLLKRPVLTRRRPRSPLEHHFR